MEYNIICVVFFTSFLTAVHVFAFVGQSKRCLSPSCCDYSCKAPRPLNISLSQVIAEQPLYVAFLPRIPIFSGIDNSCYSFIPLPDGTFLLSVSTVYVTGTSTVQYFTISSEKPGIANYGSSTCNQEMTNIALIDHGNTDCKLLIAYLCLRNGECSFQPDNDVPVMGISPSSKPISKDCLASAVDLILETGLPDQDYFILPMEGEPQCVTKIPCV